MDSTGQCQTPRSAIRSKHDSDKISDYSELRIINFSEFSIVSEPRINVPRPTRNLSPVRNSDELSHCLLFWNGQNLISRSQCIKRTEFNKYILIIYKIGFFWFWQFWLLKILILECSGAQIHHRTHTYI